MQVKLCPKCKAENKVSNVSCSSCYASLDGVVPSSSKKPEPTLVATAKPATRPQERRDEKPAGQPAPPSPYGPPPGQAPTAYGPPRREFSQPAGQGSSAGIIVLIVLLLIGAGVAGWWFYFKPAAENTPEKVFMAFIAASKSGDVEKIKPFMSKSSLEMMNSPMFAQSFKMGNKLGGSSSGGVKIISTSYEGSEKNTAVVKFESTDKTGMPPGMDPTFEFVLVKEEGKWKIDLQQSIQRIVQKVFGEMMKNGGMKMPGGQSAPGGPGMKNPFAPK